MDKTYFGLKIIGRKDLDAQDIAARLFLAPRISTEHVRRLLEMLRTGRVSLTSIMEKTEEGIDELKKWRDTGVDIPAVMKGKLKGWEESFKAPNEKDYAYLEKQYGFTRQELFEQPSSEKSLRINCVKDVSNYLKQYIKGQDYAIDRFSIPIFQHIDSIRNKYTCRIKNNCILVGPTGVAKTTLIQRVKDICDCPVIMMNSAELAGTQWKGQHILDILARELFGTPGVKNPEYPIIYIDEGDKITQYGQKITGDNGQDSSFDLQRCVMRTLDKGQVLTVEYGIDPSTMCPKTYTIPTDNFLVIIGGAFVGIEDIIRKRLNICNTIGFVQPQCNNYNDDILKYIIKDDLIEWGFMEELLGRTGNIITLNRLTADVIFEIITTAKDTILDDHLDYCSRHNIELHLTKDALYYIASEAQKSKYGFRSVKDILDEALSGLYLDIPPISSVHKCKKRVLEINKDYIIRQLSSKQF